MSNTSAASALAKSTVAVGVIDGIFAIAANSLTMKSNPMRVFQGIASVVFGRSVFDGGIATTMRGVAMHFAVAMFWSGVYLIMTRNSRALGEIVRTRRGAFSFSLAYGPSIWLVMSLLVIPLFVNRPATLDMTWWIILAGHIPFVVAPMVWASGDGRQ